ncbi:MAG: hypothetical protein RLZZ574_2841 [Cyanobacteriota bacterium]|jgi:hypothetical protein
MMESPMTRNCHVGFGERYEETHQSRDGKVRFVPTLFSPLLANIALNGIEDIHQSVRYADDMVIILKPKDDAEQILGKISDFLAERGLKVSEKKTKLSATTDGFDFLGWHFKVQLNGKFRSVPSEGNYLKFREKVKKIVNNSNYGAEVTAEKLAPIIRGWRQYHKHCKMDGSRFSLWNISYRAFTVFNKETKQDRYKAKKLAKIAFPSVPYSENRFVNVKGNKSPYDGDLVYWSKRNSVFYDGYTAKALKRQNHSCGHCHLKLTSEQKVRINSYFKVVIYDKKGNEIAESDSVNIYGLNKGESEPIKDFPRDYYDYAQLDFSYSANLKKAEFYKIKFVEGNFSASYNVSLKQSSQKNSPIFEDDNINITWIFDKKQLGFVLKNKTNSPIKIDWNQVSYIDVNSSAQKVIHSGVKYVNRNEYMSSTLVPPTAKIEDIIYPSDNISYISGKYGGWSEKPMFPEGEEAKMYEGQTFSVFMPMEINGEVKNYTFTFDINEVSY